MLGIFICYTSEKLIFLENSNWIYADIITDDNIETKLKELEKAYEEKNQMRFIEIIKDLKTFGKPSTKYLIKIISNKEKNKDFRFMLCNLIGEFKDHAIASFLLEIAKDKEDDVLIRSEALLSIGRSGDKKSISTLMEFLDDENGSLRSAAIFSLGLLKASQASKKISEILKSDENEMVRIKAVRSLGMINDEEAEIGLIQALNDNSEGVSSIAILMLGDIKSKKAIKPLIFLLKNGTYHQKVNSTKSLGEIGAKEAVEHLTDILIGDDVYLSTLAAESLVQLEAKETLPFIIKAIEKAETDKPAYEKLKEAYKKLSGEEYIKRK